MATVKGNLHDIGKSIVSILLRGADYSVKDLGNDIDPQAIVDAVTKVVRASAGMRIRTPKASLVEPQLGYCLRELEMGIQKGLGCGYGLVAIVEIIK